MRNVLLTSLAYLRRFYRATFWEFKEYHYYSWSARPRVYYLSLTLILGAVLGLIFWGPLLFIGLIFHSLGSPRITNILGDKIEAHWGKFAGSLCGLVVGAWVIGKFFLIYPTHDTLIFLLGESAAFLLGLLIGFGIDLLRRVLDEHEDPDGAAGGRLAHRVFAISALAMMARLAKADGRVSEDEIIKIGEIIDSTFQFRGEKRNEAIKVFREARSSSKPFDEYAHEFHSAFYRKPAMLVALLDVLVQVAQSDGVLSAEEEGMLRRVLRIFDLEERVLVRLLARYGHSRYEHTSAETRRPASGSFSYTDWRYAALGIAAQAPSEEIKRAYRKAVLECHPDRLLRTGLPRELHARAKERFLKIQQAYDSICQERRIS